MSTGPVLYQVALILQSRISDYSLGVSAFSINPITNSLLSFELQNQYWDHLQGLQLADPEFLVPSNIDILLGAYGELIQSEIRKGSPHDPVAQLTHFGWVVLGPTEELGLSQVTSSHVSVEHGDLRDILIRFWEQEEVLITTEGRRHLEKRVSFYILRTVYFTTKSVATFFIRY